ncbi:hypothetical protein BU17DRAFT_99214 [Hysterangium stoloniferum]|nr:hypothetical protein BU17DRAFT_99214 [Hysterangium stoloniferum]
MHLDPTASIFGGAIVDSRCTYQRWLTLAILASLFFKVLIANVSTVYLLAAAVSGWTPAIFSIVGPRLVLNLRSVNKTEDEGVEDPDNADHREMQVESVFVAATNPRRDSLDV